MTAKELREALATVPDDFPVLFGNKVEWKRGNFLTRFDLRGCVILQEFNDRGFDKGLDMTPDERIKSFKSIVDEAARWYLWPDKAED